MTCERTSFGWSCIDTEEAWIASVGMEHVLEQEAAERDEDMRARLDGDCERCGEPQSLQLTIVGGEALCLDCLHVELDVDDRPRRRVAERLAAAGSEALAVRRLP